MWLHRAGAMAVLSALTLGSAIGRSDDASKVPPPPAAGFLEFLGSVDRLSEVNPNYLSRPIPAKRARPAANGTAPAPAAPAAAPSPPGEKNNG